MSSSRSISSCGFVLIETLWNVKQKPIFSWLNERSINRNIVECKEESGISYQGSLVRINRNIVECKECYIVCPSRKSIVLIETLWNVKTDNMLVKAQALGINRNIVECKGISSRCKCNSLTLY